MVVKTSIMFALMASIFAGCAGGAVLDPPKPKQERLPPPTEQQKEIIKKYLEGLKNPQAKDKKKHKKVTDVTATVVQLSALDKSFGSGSIVSEDGYIITAAHVAELFKNNKPMFIHTTDGRTLTGHVVAVSKKCDVAIVKADNATDLPVLPISGAPIRVGEPLTIWGYSGGRLAPKYVKFEGYINAYGSFGKDDMLLSTGIQPGDSGGPIVNSDGVQVGLGVAKDLKANKSMGVSIGHCDSLIQQYVR